jgi:hypothetical protein
VNELSAEMVQAIRKEGGCIGHAKGNCQFGTGCNHEYGTGSREGGTGEDWCVRRSSCS